MEQVLSILQNFRQLYADMRKEASNREDYIYYGGSLDAIDKVIKKLEPEQL